MTLSHPIPKEQGGPNGIFRSPQNGLELHQITYCVDRDIIERPLKESELLFRKTRRTLGEQCILIGIRHERRSAGIALTSHCSALRPATRRQRPRTD